MTTSLATSKSMGERERELEDRARSLALREAALSQRATEQQEQVRRIDELKRHKYRLISNGIDRHPHCAPLRSS